MIKEFYICKIFSRVGLKDLEFNLKIFAIDKNVIRIYKYFLNISKLYMRKRELSSFVKV